MSNPLTYVVKWRPNKETPWVISIKDNKDIKEFASKVIFEVRSETVKGNIEATGNLVLKDGIATIGINNDI